MRRFFRSAAFPILIVIVLAFFAQRLISPPSTEKTPTFNEFRQSVETSPDQIDTVTFEQKTETIKVVEADKDEYTTGYPPDLQASVVNQLDRQGVETIIEGTGGSSFLSILTYILPFLLFFGFWIFLMNQVQGGGSKVMSFGKSRAKRMTPDSPKIGFKDVAGVDEAVEELQEIKEFLENPKKFQALG
ncbi:MAG: ATP-dependent metallopeptidase FtsH/Yme1/Tma family protein, partial [Solirubrobacterales bacterium]